MTENPVFGTDAVLKLDVFCTLNSDTKVAGYTVAGIFKGMYSFEVSSVERKVNKIYDTRKKQAVSDNFFYPVFCIPSPRLFRENSSPC